MNLKSGTTITVAALLLLLLACTGCADKAEETEDHLLGLEKTSVFETPDPVLAQVTAGEPGENETREAYFEESPPMIPHQVEEFLPIRVGDNQCMGCHDTPDAIGTGTEAGDPTPIPASHYTDLRNDPGTVNSSVTGARFFCVQCHAPQTDAEPLVANTYSR